MSCPPSGIGLAVLVLTAWVATSTTLIIFNAAVLGSFRHPIALTCWHQFVSVVFIVIIGAAFPQAVATGDSERGVPPLTLGAAIRLGFPIAVLQSIGLVCGNTAIMYLSLAFCQMMKSFTPASVYTCSCLLGVQSLSLPIMKCICVITVGLIITSFGELKFNLFGFLMQGTALVTEGLRLTLLEVHLKAAGYKLNALSSVMVFAPMVCGLLFAAALLFDRDSFDVEQINEIGVGVFVANAGVAFILNISIYLAIQSASGLIFALAGIVKDFMIVIGGCIFQGRPITTTQMVGYGIAILGLQAYGVVSRAPEDFEGGVVAGLFRKACGPAEDAEKDAEKEGSLRRKGVISTSLSSSASTGCPGDEDQESMLRAGSVEEAVEQ